MALPIALPDRTSRCCDLPRLLCHLAARSAVPLGHYWATVPLSHTCERHRRPGTRRSERLGGSSHDRARRKKEGVVAVSRSSPCRTLLTPRLQYSKVHFLVGIQALHMRLPTRHNTVRTLRLNLSLSFCQPADSAPALLHATRYTSSNRRLKVEGVTSLHGWRRQAGT
jgi:hypothetical protein